MAIDFKLLNSDKKARAGILKTKHGEVQTPIFMPVGTAGTVKALDNNDLEEVGAQIILANTYHMLVKAGKDVMKHFGGVHKFINWDKPLLTDSGGFQVMSLSGLNKITEEGVVFRAHNNGQYYSLTVEESIEFQKLLGANITMALDKCIKYPSDYKDVREAMELSLRWAGRSLNAFDQRDGYGIFGIVQGGMFKDLRIQSASEMVKMNFDGFAIGGLSVGEPQDVMMDMIDVVEPYLPKNKPRYLMGVGRPSDIILGIERGIDMFDCVIPTRSGRNGKLFTSLGEINIKNAIHTFSDKPVDENCSCSVCKNYSRGYLRHLYKNSEILGSMLMSKHNVYYYLNLVKQARNAILNNQFDDFKNDFFSKIYTLSKK